LVGYLQHQGEKMQSTLRRTFAIGLVSIASLIGLAEPSSAQTRIKFPRGSFCGDYAGDFRRPKRFVLGLAAYQEFVVRNTGVGTQYNITVSGPTGTLQGYKPRTDSLSYTTEAKGDHIVRISATQRYTSVQFCAY
jgi:hypothetical protein